MPVNYGRATPGKDLWEILELQARNLPEQLSEAAREREGFLTVSHSYELLEKMNAVCPHVVAMDKGRVVGYALCMHPDFSDKIPILYSMFEMIKAHLGDRSYMVMGQVCVHEDYRGKGIFRGLYREMKEALNNQCELIVTEVDDRNRRSLEAHLAVGFRVLKKYQSHDRDWHLIVLQTKD